MKYEQVITSYDIQNIYLKFYSKMMQYLWDIATVMDLARLEIAIFKRFPDKSDMKTCIHKLESDILSTYNSEAAAGDNEFKSIFEKLESYIDAYDSAGLEIYDTNIITSIDTILDKSVENNKTIHVGKIVRR